MTAVITWICTAMIFGTVIMFGALGEILTEKSGHLNLGVPGLMFFGAFSGFASAYLYETSAETPSKVLMILIPLVTAFLVSCLGGLLYAFMTDILRANQNVTGLALTSLGVGVGTFGGAYILKVYGTGTFATAEQTSRIYCANIAQTLGIQGFGKIFLSYGFLFYVAIILAVLMQLFFNKTRVGLNLRAIGESPATADAAGINVTLYKILSTTIGGGICGIGGLAYTLMYANGGWTTTNGIESVGWLAVALVIFATWKPVNAIWGSYVFALLYCLYTYVPTILNVKINSTITNLLQMLPYVVTIVVLVTVSMRKKRENQPPAALGLSYFREER